MTDMTERRLPAPWSVVEIAGGFKVIDATGRPMAYVYGRDDLARRAGFDGLTMDEARRVAAQHCSLACVAAA